MMVKEERLEMSHQPPLVPLLCRGIGPFPRRFSTGHANPTLSPASNTPEGTAGGVTHTLSLHSVQIRAPPRWIKQTKSRKYILWSSMLRKTRLAEPPVPHTSIDRERFQLPGVVGSSALSLKICIVFWHGVWKTYIEEPGMFLKPGASIMIRSLVVPDDTVRGCSSPSARFFFRSHPQGAWGSLPAGSSSSRIQQANRYARLLLEQCWLSIWLPWLWMHCRFRTKFVRVD